MRFAAAFYWDTDEATHAFSRRFFDGRWIIFAAGFLAYQRVAAFDRPAARRAIDVLLVAGLLAAGLVMSVASHPAPRAT